MARIRSVHPGLFTDEAFVSLSCDAQIFLVGIWTECDDQGVFEWKPRQLKMKLRGGKDGDVEPLLSEIAAANCIHAYEVGGRKLGAVRNFKRYQRPKKPNSIYPISREMRTFVGIAYESGEPVQYQRGTSSPKPPQMEDGGDSRRMEGESTPTTESNLIERGVRDFGEENSPSTAPPSPETDQDRPPKAGKPSEAGKVNGSHAPDLPGIPATPKPEPPPEKPAHDLDGAVDAYNRMAKPAGLPICEKLTEPRKRQLRMRLDEAGAEGWAKVLAKVAVSSFLRGLTGDRFWRASFDFILQPSSFTKILEGQYDDKPAPGGGSGGDVPKRRTPSGPPPTV